MTRLLGLPGALAMAFLLAYSDSRHGDLFFPTHRVAMSALATLVAGSLLGWSLGGRLARLPLVSRMLASAGVALAAPLAGFAVLTHGTDYDPVVLTTIFMVFLSLPIALLSAPLGAAIGVRRRSHA